MAYRISNKIRFNMRYRIESSKHGGTNGNGLNEM